MDKDAKLLDKIALNLWNEQQDFVVRARRVDPKSGSIISIIFWSVSFFISLPFYFIIWSVEKIFLFPPLLFSLVGIGFLISWLRRLYEWPAYFIWTPTKLIRVHWKGIDSFSREQFNGTINIVWDNTRWTLSFILKSRQSPYDFSSGNVDLYVVYTISMIDIENMFEIEKLCRMRIQEVMQKNKPQPLF